MSDKEESIYSIFSNQDPGSGGYGEREESETSHGPVKAKSSAAAKSKKKKKNKAAKKARKKSRK